MRKVDHTRLVNTFLDLVEIPSPSGHEDEIAEFLIAKLKSLNFEVIVDTYGNVIGKLTGNGDPIILCGHMDTVQLGDEDMVSPQTIFKDAREIIKSNGKTILGADNKDNIAAILEAIHIVIENNIDHRSIEVVFTRDEEMISKGAANLDYSLLEGKKCVISDSSEPYGHVIVGAPYCYRWDGAIVGRRSHARRPTEGINAILAATDIVSNMPTGLVRGKADVMSNVSGIVGGLSGEIDKLFVKIQEQMGDAFDQQSFVDFMAGQNRNTVADLTKVWGEVRGADIEVVQSVIQSIKDAFAQASKTFTVSTGHSFKKLASGYFFEKDDELVQLVDKIMIAQGFYPQHIVSNGGSDANIMNEHGIKTIVISSAHRDNHKKTEICYVHELVALADFFEKLISI